MGDSFIGTTILGYTILREIGEGGMGKVYLAENQTFGQQVAIKILDPVLARNPELRERFAQEARIQIALQHNNIVSVMNAQCSEELSFLVMEYIDGQSLDQVLKRRGKLSVEESVKIFSQVLDAVGYAHDKGVIHRDLKPSNILVCADGTSKVTDFGIAKVLGDTKLTRTGTSMGSPDYMSPEQVLGKKDIDHRTDIYSLGATLYEMLTGKPPFVIENGGTSDSDFLVKQAHVQSEPEQPTKLDSKVPEYLSRLVLRALSKNSQSRFVDCKDFKALLVQTTAADPLYPEAPSESQPDVFEEPKEKRDENANRPAERTQFSFNALSPVLAPFVILLGFLFLVFMPSIVILSLNRKSDSSEKRAEQSVMTESDANLMKDVLEKIFGRSRTRDPLRNQVINDFEPLIRSIVEEYRETLPPKFGIEDIYTAAAIGLFEAIDKYDPSKNEKFTTYAEFMIRSAILHYSCGCSQISNFAFRKNESIFIEHKHSLLDCIKNNLNSKSLKTKGVRDIILKTVEELPEKHKLVLSLSYYEDLTSVEIGRILDIPETKVEQLREEAVLLIIRKFSDISVSLED